MATIHTLLAMTNQVAPTIGNTVALAGRSRITATTRIARTAGPLSLAIEASADNDLWDALHTFAESATGIFSAASPADFVVPAYYKYLRANLVSVTGALVECEITAPFIDTTADAALFSQELRGFADGFARIVGNAEDDVLGQLVRSANVPRSGRMSPAALPIWSGVMFGYTDRYGQSVYDSDPNITEQLAETPAELVSDARFDLAGFGEIVRAAIVRQAEHRFRRYKLEQQNDPASAVTLRSLAEIAPGLMRQLDKYRYSQLSAWRGR